MGVQGVFAPLITIGSRVSRPSQTAPDTWVYGASLHLDVELLVIAGVIVGPFAGGTRENSTPTSVQIQAILGHPTSGAYPTHRCRRRGRHVTHLV